jgi:hypothetical protein
LLQAVAERFVARWLTSQGGETRLSPEDPSAYSSHITYLDGPRITRVSVWADPYYGTEDALCMQRDLPFYRGRSDVLAIPAPRDDVPAPVFSAGGERRIAYLRLALPRPEDEVAALLRERDGVFFDEIGVVDDRLLVVDAQELYEWTVGLVGVYPTRPVISRAATNWFLLIPELDVLTGVSSADVVGRIAERTLAPSSSKR